MGTIARCGCASALCTCTIQSASANVTIGGLGSASNPYTVQVDPAVVQVQNTSSIKLTITGAGTQASPYVISGTATYAPSGNMVQTGQATIPIIAANTSATVVVTFPTPFNATPRVVVSWAGGTLSQLTPLTVTAVTTTQCTITGMRTAGSTSLPANWVAVGT